MSRKRKPASQVPKELATNKEKILVTKIKEKTIDTEFSAQQKPIARDLLKTFFLTLIILALELVLYSRLK